MCSKVGHIDIQSNYAIIDLGYDNLGYKLYILHPHSTVLSVETLGDLCARPELSVQPASGPLKPMLSAWTRNVAEVRVMYIT
jgi:hypothetical protein